MITSQITAVSQASFTIQASTASLRLSSISRRPGKHGQQARGFRFGLWSSYLDPAFQKEIRRRHRVLKHKYADVVNRQSSWDRKPRLHQPHWSFKSFMYSAWRGHDTRPGGRWVNMEEVENTNRPESPQRSPSIDGFDKLFGRHNARIIEDFIRQSRGAFGRGWNSDTISHFSTTSSSDGLFKIRTPPAKEDNEVSEIPPEAEYDIDPISNRKVYRKDARQPSSSQIPVKTFKGYRSQFSKFDPPNIENFEDELKEYSKPVTYNEPDGQPPLQPGKVKEALEDYDQKHAYEPYMFNEPEGKLPEKPDPVREALKYYDERHSSYDQPFTFNEPDGQPPEIPDKVQEALQDYDRTHKHNPLMYNEPDGNQTEKPDPVREALQYYDERHSSYDQPHTFNEPDGQLAEHPDPVKKSLKDYDQRNSYDQPITFNEPDGQLPMHQDLTAEGLKDYDRDHEYQPFFYNHPDGHGAQKSDETVAPDTNGESTKSSRPKSKNWVIDTNKQDDLDLLRASDIRASSGIIRGVKMETEAEKQSRRINLERDFSRSSISQVQSEDEVAAANKVKQSRKLAEELEIERSELLNHNAHARGKVNARIAELEAEASADLANKSTERKLTGNFVRDFPEEFNASWTTENCTGQETLIPKHTANCDAWGYDKSPQGLELSYRNEKENSIQAAEQDYATQVSSQEWQSPGSKSTRLETSLDRKHKGDDRFQAEIDPYSKEPQGLETCFAEEVAANGGEIPLFVSSYGCGKEKSAKAQKDKNEDRKKQKELVREIRAIYEEKYGTIECKHRQVSEGGAAETEQPSSGKSSPDPKTQGPTVYKILAYDPTMQEINIAETTSIVPDASAPLTPAEVLLRLSQPAKFFPHFHPLQSQGYEIASGSGDVLVFRKVRDGPIKVSASRNHGPRKSYSADIKSHTHGGKQINPIDGMKHIPQPQPAAANFASPTGFVGEPMTLDDLELEEPRFKSNIDVRREEDVFSGRKTGWQEGEKKMPRKLARKLAIGAVWVAGCSYAIGVVAEFFRTGGADGQGPIGF